MFKLGENIIHVL